jgi:hypothetical protein
VVTPEWTMNADGLVPVPMSAPGLGVEVDTDFIQSLTSRTETLEPRGAPVAVG